MRVLICTHAVEQENLSIVMEPFEDYLSTGRNLVEHCNTTPFDVVFWIDTTVITVILHQSL